MQKPWISLLLLAIVLGLSSTAAAQAKKKGKAKGKTPAAAADDGEAAQQAKAKEHYVAGKEHYDAGRFGEALASFTEAYNVSEKPDLLYNLGVCCEQLGQREKAIAYYELYLEEKPDAPDAQEVRGRLEKLRAPIPAPTPPPVEEPAPVEEPTPVAEPEPAAEPTGEQDDDAQAADVELLDLGQGEQDREVFWPGVVIGVGGLVLATGTLTAISAYKRYGELEDSCAPDCSDGKVAKPKKLALAADIQFGIGGAAVVAGVIWWIATAGDDEAGGAELSAWRAAPTALDGGGGLMLEGRF